MKWCALKHILTGYSLTVALALAERGPELILLSDSPAVLDAPITFHAVLSNADSFTGPFYFHWNDDASPEHFSQNETWDRQMQYTISFSSKTYEAMQYRMDVRVYVKVSFFREEIAANSIQFEITNKLNGVILVHEDARKYHVITNQEVAELRANIYDPAAFLDGALIQYFWFINDTNYGPTENATFYYTFSSPGISTAEVLILATIGQNESWPEAGGLGNMTAAPKHISTPPSVKTGVFRTLIESRAPVTYLNVSGETWLKHGKLLQLDVLCDGSGPWNYCWSIHDAPFNVTENETCSEPQTTAQICEFPILWYFRLNGTFDIVTVVENQVSKVVKVVHVNIYQVNHQTPLSFVVLPIVSFLLAIVAVGSGIVVWLTFKRNIAVETADFDFSSPDEHLEYKTFWERLRDSMVNAFSSASDDVSHLSSVSSNYVANPGSIHYGTIS